MTREEYIKIKKELDESKIDFPIVDEVVDIMKKYIKEQESKTDALDKIRAEIQENINYNKKMNYQGIVAGLLLTLDIIDKYKAESEDQE